MNPLAQELNASLQAENPHIYNMLSAVGRKLFFPKGILSQGAEAKAEAYALNATIGIATENQGIMHFPSVMDAIDGLAPESSLTYAPSYGLPQLREEWQKSLVAKNPSLDGKQISLPVVTCGITHAVSVLADLWVDPGDVVILPDMMWGNYSMIMDVRKGAVISQYPVFSDAGGYNVDALEALIRKEAQTRDKLIVLLNFPHNPTGYAPTEAEGRRICDVLTDVAKEGTQLVVALDDSYFGLFYETETLKESIFATLADRHERLLAVKLDGATKENFVWGLRVGFMTYGIKLKGDGAPVYDALTKKTAGCVRGSISNASHLSQSIVLKSMQSSAYEAEKKEKFDTLMQRAMRVKAVLKNEKYAEAFEAYPFNSGYFMCLKLKAVDAEPLRRHLLENYGVGLIALGQRNLRVAFSCVDEENIEQLFDTVLKGAMELQQASK